MLETVFPDNNKIQKWLINLSITYPDISKLLSAFQLNQHYVRSQKEIFQKACEQKLESFIFPEMRVDVPSVLKHLIFFLFLIAFASILWISNESLFEKAMQKAFFIKADNEMTYTGKIVFTKKIYRSVEKDTLIISGDLLNNQKGEAFTIIVSGSSPEMSLELFPELLNSHFQFPLSLSKGIYSVKGRIKKNNVEKYLPDSSEIIILEKPFIKYFSVKITPPSYTFLNSFTLTDRGNLSLLPGSRVYVNGTINKVITDADLVLNGTKIITLAKKKKQFFGHFYAKNISEWSISIRDVDSLKINTNPSYSINYLLDTPPIIKINEPEGDVKLFNIDFIPLLYTVEDDYGISKVSIKYRIIRPGMSAEKFQQSEINKNIFENLPLKTRYRWNLSELGVFAGETIEYFLMAWDNNEVDGFQYAQTDTYRIYIPSLFENIVSNEEHSMEVDKQLDKISTMADQIRKKMEDLKRRLKQKEKFDFQLKTETREQLKEQEQLYNEIEKLSEKLNKKLSEMEKQGPIAEDTMEKYQQIQQMLQDLLPPDIKERLKKLQDLMEKEDAKNFSSMLEEFDKEKFAEEVDRIHELLKKMENEQQLENLKSAFFKLSEDQKQISDSLSEKKWNQAEKKENNVSQDFKGVSSIMKSVMKKIENKEINIFNEKKHGLSKSLGDSLNNEISETKESIMNKQNNALQKSQSLAQVFASMAGKMQNMREQYQNSNKNEIVAKLDKVITAALDISKEQEENRKKMSRVNTFSQTHPLLSKRQAQLAKQLDILKRELIEIGNETFLLPDGVFSRAENARKHMLNAAEQLSQKRIPSAKNFQNQALGEINILSYQLLQSLDNVQKSQSGSGSESFMEMMQKLSGAQGQLTNEGMQLMQNGGASQSDIQKLGARQRAIKEAMEEAMNKSGSGKGTTGRMNEVMDEMEKVSQLLDQGRLDAAVVKRQQKLFDRLLDSQKSLRQKEKSKKRESEEARPYFVVRPHEKRMNDTNTRLWETYFRKLQKQKFQNQLMQKMRQYYEKID